MLRHTGRAAIEVGKNLHRLLHALLTLAVLTTVAVLAGAWRLSHGPVDLGIFKGRVEQALDTSFNPIRVTIGGASIAWAGFSHGLDQPLILRLTDLTIDSAAGSDRVQIPLAEAALSARWLLIGRVVPRRITLQGARLLLVRNLDGSLSFDIGGSGSDAGEQTSPLTGLLAVLGSPAETDREAGGRQLSQLSAVSIRDARLRLEDRPLGMTWSADRADIDLTRHRGGGMEGKATLALTLGGHQAALDANFNLPPAARSVHVAARLSPVTPKALSEAAPVLKPLAALDMPLALNGEADFTPGTAATRFRLTARAGVGQVNIASGSIPIRRAEVTFAGTPEQATIENAIVELPAGSGNSVSTVTASGQMTHQSGQLAATIALNLDRLAFADLPALWPAGLNRPTRAWITQNITNGTASEGKAALTLTAADDGSAVTLVNATATLEGEGVTVAWLPTVPPVEQAKAHLVLTDPDKVEIDVRSARQKVNGADPIGLQNGHVTITGLAQRDQVATIRLVASGSIPSALALLKEPRLHMLDRHPMDLRAPAGDVRMNLTTTVPLELNLSGDDVGIRGSGNLNKVHLSGIVLGRDLDEGNFTIDVDNNHLALKGGGRLAGVPANIDAMMDFRSGPPSQVLQHYAVNGRASASVLAAAGLDTKGALSGEVGVSLTLNEYRSGAGEVTADADLTQSVLDLAPLGWRKPAGGAAHAAAHLTLGGDKLTGVDRISIDGPGVQVRGGVTVLDGKPDTIRLDRLALGQTDLKGTIHLPHGGPIGVDLTGPVLDVSAKLLEKPAKRDPAAPEVAGTPWSLRGRFERVVLAHGQVANEVSVTADNDGLLYRDLAITGRTDSGKSIRLQIGRDSRTVPAGKSPAMRRLVLNADDAGGLLHGLDATSSIQGGQLTVDGDFDDTTRQHTLEGTLTLTDFRVSGAPGLGKLLQAVTLYGLVDALSGPGLSFSRLTAPFQYHDDTLTLRDARAFSPSLGLTAKGQIDWGDNRVDVEGTLVPAYVFNSMLGRIPLIGGLFSAEKGGGLFAMNYSLHGPADNPTVVANPLSALTPGILRGMFGLFDQAPAGQSPEQR